MTSIINKTIVVWFSSGAASAVAAKKTIELYGKHNLIYVVNNPIKEEHSDNIRFLYDVENWLQHPIIFARNINFPNASIVEVFDKRNYMSGIHGAPCTMLLKKEARYQFEKRINIDWHVLGFTADEWQRQVRFNQFERSNTIPILAASNITKQHTFDILHNAGIRIPEIYNLAYPNANCIGCVKATSPSYWNLTRILFPDVFNHRATQSRRIGAKLVRVKGKRIFLDELKSTDKGAKLKYISCGIFC